MKKKFIRSITMFALASAVAGANSALAESDICMQPAVSSLTQPQPANIEGAPAYVYKSIKGIDLRLHVFTPTNRTSAKLPAIVFFFGGGWMWGNVTESVPQAKYLSSRGMIAILADYRVYCRNKADVTEEMADAKSAIRWVRSHARELGVDPDRIVASGGSSGGHLALSTAAFEKFDEPSDDRAVSSRPDALVLFFPCVDATTDDERQYSSFALGSHGKDVSPLYHIGKGLPPMVILQGTADPLYASVSQYCREVTTLGNSCEFFQYEGAPHGFFRPTANEGRWYRPALLETDHFLTRLGYLPGPSPAALPEPVR
jgi:acetyl esterase/lipase